MSQRAEPGSVDPPTRWKDESFSELESQGSWGRRLGETVLVRERSLVSTVIIVAIVALLGAALASL